MISSEPQAIEAAIELNLETVEAGAQGEHKIQRGYLPVITYSCHYLRDEEFRGAIGDFLIRESSQVWWVANSVKAHYFLLFKAWKMFASIYILYWDEYNGTVDGSERTFTYYRVFFFFFLFSRIIIVVLLRLDRSSLLRNSCRILVLLRKVSFRRKIH